MKHARQSPLAAFVPLATGVVFLATHATAQGTLVPPQQAQGLATNMPVGVMLRGESGASSLRIRAPGTASGVPTPWSDATFSAASAHHPDYSFEALTQWAPSDLPPPKFGGISSGGERMPAVDADGVLQVGFENWFMLAVTVDANAEGLAESMVAARSAGGRNPAGDIVSYYPADNDALHPMFPHTVRLEASREQLQLADVLPVPDGGGEIDNLDFGIGVISVDPLNRAGSLFPVRNAFYFTLRKDWVADAVAANKTINGAPPSASTVYGMEWSSGAWSAPVVAFSHALLFGESVPTSGVVEIDALTVDRGSGSFLLPQRVVFSLTPQSNTSTVFYDQILVHSRGTCATQALKSAEPDDGPVRPLSEHLGLVQFVPEETDPDNVSSVCTLDPNEPYMMKAVMGLATDQHLQGEGRFGFTVFRTDTPSDPPNQDVLHLQLSGLDFSPHQFGIVVLQKEGPPVGAGVPPASPEKWGEPLWIDPQSAALNVIGLSVLVDDKPDTETLRMTAQLYGMSAPLYVPVLLRQSWVIGFRL